MVLVVSSATMRSGFFVTTLTPNDLFGWATVTDQALP
jgi:hypothetical protein